MALNTTNMKLIKKDKLVAQIAKKAKIDTAKATIAYETVLNESPAFRKQSIKTVTVTKEVIKEVPVEVIKEVTLVREVEKVMTKDMKVSDDKTVKSLKSKLDALQKKYDASQASVKDLKKQLSAKPKTIIKEVPVEIIREIEVVKQIDFSSLQQMMKGMKTVEVSKKVVGETRTKKEGKIVSRKEVKEGSRSKVSKGAKPTTKPTTGGNTDDLTKIEGIGPKISGLLHGGGIKTFVTLSKTAVSKIQELLNAAGPRYQMHKPGSWPKQAGLAADGKWDVLKRLQDELNGGK